MKTKESKKRDKYLDRVREIYKKKKKKKNVSNSKLCCAGGPLSENKRKQKER